MLHSFPEAASGTSIEDLRLLESTLAKGLDNRISKYLHGHAWFP
jgi:hypothetical protein